MVCVSDELLQSYAVGGTKIIRQIKRLLVNERPRDLSLARLRDLICRVYKRVNGRTRNKEDFV